LEGLVHGARASADILKTLEAEGQPPLEVPPVAPVELPNGHETLDLSDIRESLRALMWRNVGITRDTKGLAEAARQVDFWCRYALGQVFHDPAGWAMQNMLTVARLMISAAQTRTESRGVHTRREFPEADPEWEHHITHRIGGNAS
jgi:L-aspartate oxidase